jgi:transcriptional regulator with XRE-family HTH domain
MDIHKRIKQRRLELGMTQEQLAKAVGMGGAQAAQKWESGWSAPTRSRMPIVAKVLQVTEEWLVTGREYDQSISPKHHAWLELLDYLSEDDIAEFTAMIKERQARNKRFLESQIIKPRSPNAKKIADEPELTPEEIELIRSYRKAPPIGKNLIQTSARTATDSDEELDNIDIEDMAVRAMSRRTA